MGPRSYFAASYAPGESPRCLIHHYPKAASSGSVTIAYEGLVYGIQGEDEIPPGLSPQAIAARLLASYLEDPDGFFRRLKGQCTVAVFGSQRVESFRTRLSAAQIYYSDRGLGNRLLPVYQLSGSPALDAGYFLDFVTERPSLHFDSASTPFDGIRRLPPGARLRIQGGRPEVVDAPAEEEKAPSFLFDQREEEVTGNIRSILEQAVTAQLGAGDRPVVCELSGGLDSSFVTGLLAARGLRPKALMYSFPERPSHRFSEACARAVADYCGLDLTVIPPEDIPKSDASALKPYRDEPHPSFWQSAFFFPCVRAHVPDDALVFGGVGADQLFLRSASSLPGLLKSGHPRLFWETLSDFSKDSQRSRAHLLWQSAVTLLPGVRRLGRPFEGRRFNPFATLELSPGPAATERIPWLDTRLASVNARDRRDESRNSARLDFSYMMAPRLNQDAFHESRGLTSAHPFFDARLIDYALGEISPHLIHDWKKPYKHLVREAQRGLVPEEVRTRPKNEFFFDGFLARFLTDNRGYLRDLVAHPEIPFRELIRISEAQEALGRLFFGINDASTAKLLSLIAYSSWWRDFREVAAKWEDPSINSRALSPTPVSS